MRSVSKDKGEKIVKRIILLSLLLVLGCSCVNQKVVQYNEERLNNIESFLKNQKFVHGTDGIKKLEEEGLIDYKTEYKSLEEEASKWENRK